MDGENRSRAARSSLLSRPSMVRLLEYAGAPLSEKVPASSGVELYVTFRSSARSRVESGSSVTPGRVKTRSNGDRFAIGRFAVSRDVNVAPTTVRFVSMIGASFE